MATFELEQELIEKISRLDREKQHQVLGYVDRLLESPEEKPQMTLGEWLKQADALRTELQAKYGDNHFGSVQSIIDEIREERLNDLMDSR